MNGEFPQIDLLLMMDTTGSMYPCTTQLKRDAKALVLRLLRDNTGLRIGFLVHGDYCDADSSYVTKHLNFTSDAATICRFLEGVEATGGGDAPECYELGLHEARSFSWRAGAKKALVVVGDDVPHEPNYPENTLHLDWRNELRLLVEAGIHVHGMHAMPGIRKHSTWFYKKVAEMTGGHYLTLDQFALIHDIVMAICYEQAGSEQLQQFQQEVQDGHRMNRNMAAVFNTMSGGGFSVAAARPGLIPVPAGRFQVIQIDADAPIRDFVNAQGLTFKKGRGFYEFMKTETIQEKKEVVLMDRKTGDMYTGDEAREMIGLPYGMRGRIKPTVLEQYRVFVQSTSVNRKLVGGTKFLYEVKD